MPPNERAATAGPIGEDATVTFGAQAGARRRDRTPPPSDDGHDDDGGGRPRRPETLRVGPVVHQPVTDDQPRCQCQVDGQRRGPEEPGGRGHRPHPERPGPHGERREERTRRCGGRAPPNGRRPPRRPRPRPPRATGGRPRHRGAHGAKGFDRWRLVHRADDTDPVLPVCDAATLPSDRNATFDRRHSTTTTRTAGSPAPGSPSPGRSTTV